MHILVCSPGWPTSKTIDFVFVEQLCQALSDAGHNITVIAPQSVTKCIVRHIPLSKRHYRYQTKRGNVIEVFRPYTISFGNLGVKLFGNSGERAIKRAFNRVKQKPDVCYGHFWQSIFALLPLSQKAGIPLFGASGEEDISYYIHETEETKEVLRNYISGVVSVSSKNQLECFSLNLVDKEKSVIIPNAIDQTLFYKQDKAKCRKEMGLNQNDFIVAFVGQLMPRKGTLRLNEALKKIGDNGIKAVFIGSGIEDPDYEGIIYKGRAAHDDVPKWLNAADVFVLPTENEGCCNAIIEAMACGLPIISTDAPFNHDILNERNSIMVDCHDIDAIAKAICKLKADNTLRRQLSEGALATVGNLTIGRRAEKIVEFMQGRMNKENA